MDLHMVSIHSISSCQLSVLLVCLILAMNSQEEKASFSFNVVPLHTYLPLLIFVTSQVLPYNGSDDVDAVVRVWMKCTE